MDGYQDFLSSMSVVIFPCPDMIRQFWNSMYDYDTASLYSDDMHVDTKPALDLPE